MEEAPKVLSTEEAVRLISMFQRQVTIGLDPFGNVYKFGGPTKLSLGNTDERLLTYYIDDKSVQAFTCPERYVIIECFGPDGRPLRSQYDTPFITVHHVARRWVAGVPEIVFLSQNERHIALIPTQTAVLDIVGT
jgi:hypothetical protein